MKKIMFNDEYGLTAAVLDGRKTMTRRAIPVSIGEVHYRPTVANCYFFSDSNDREVDPRYHIGEVVAIAQSYKDCGYDGDAKSGWCYDENEQPMDVHFKEEAGWTNKMFVGAYYMPHHIRIMDIKVERLQDISGEDCIKEGIFKWGDPFHEDRVEDFGFFGATKHYMTPKAAFASLIDKVSGNGTWERNPWVFAYSFKLID